MSTTVLEKDLKFLSDLNVEDHVYTVVAKTNNRLGIIRRNFAFLNKEMMMALYLSLMRSLLAYAVQCWSPFLIKGINNIEKIQHCYKNDKGA